MFVFSSTSRPAVEFTGPLIQLVSEIFPGVKWPGREGDNFELVPRLRMGGAVPLLPVFAIMACARTTLTFYFYKVFIDLGGEFVYV